SIVNAASFCTLYHFMNIAFALKDNILLTLPSTHPVDEPPNVLLPAIKTFLGASCSLDDGGIDLAWSLLKALVWTGNLKSISFHHYKTRTCTPQGVVAASSCKTDYFHNYSINHTYYTTVPANIQVAEHVYIEHQVIELFITSIEVSWTSATNCARLYNIALRLGKEAPQDYPVRFVLTSDHVWDGFILLALLEDCECHHTLLIVPHCGNQNEHLKDVMRARNQRIQLYGHEEFRRHYCKKCTRMYKDPDGKPERRISVVVIDGVTVGHSCCAIFNCYIPPSNNRHRFCPTHRPVQENLCSMIGCDNPIVNGHRTSSIKEHQYVEETGNTPATAVTKKKKRVRAQFGHHRTFCQELLVAPCGLISYRTTYYGAKGVASVAVRCSLICLEGSPAHIFYDNNCHLAKHIKGDAYFQDIGLSVDIFHFHCKHSEKDTFCQENCNPAAFPELKGEGGKGWFFNSSIAEQTNAWFGGYHSICQEMLVDKFNFFLDEMIIRGNRGTLQKLAEGGQTP
ncbi:hypothetical protein BDR03DRAFT_802478, partial [Suillus americanus]